MPCLFSPGQIIDDVKVTIYTIFHEVVTFVSISCQPHEILEAGSACSI